MKGVIMSKIEELEVYQKALMFSNMIWEIVVKWDYFKKKTVGDQLVRAADSISANIAEGYGRFHYKENLHFCYYARGSYEETKDWLRKSYKRNLITESEKDSIENFIVAFPKQLNSYIKYIKGCLKK
jgi:four helix bundle protein